jgi:hypothetical protein
MKPEHTKPFNAEHAKAGAPFAQRNGLAARIGIWDAIGSYPLAGVKSCTNEIEVASSWTNDGHFHKTGPLYENDLIMLPLGYCEGKPVFVGETLFKDGLGNYRINLSVWRRMRQDNKNFDRHRWPCTAPVIPTLGSLERTDIEYMLSTYRSEIEAYWKALDEFNEAGK